MSRVPEDFHTITPQLVVRGVADAIDWYTKALGAHELLRNRRARRQIDHAFGAAARRLALLCRRRVPGLDGIAGGLGGTSVTLHLYVQDVDALFGARRRGRARPC